MENENAAQGGERSAWEMKARALGFTISWCLALECSCHTPSEYIVQCWGGTEEGAEYIPWSTS